MPTEADRFSKFIVDYIKNEDFQTLDLKLLRKLCNNISHTDLVTIIKRCRRKIDNNTCLHVAADEENFEMIDILLGKLNDEEKLRLLKIKATYNSVTVTWLCIINGGTPWAMALARSSTHEALRREIYEAVLVYTCQNDDSQALQLLLGVIPSDTLLPMLRTITLGSLKLSCIQTTVRHGLNTFISMLLQHLSTESKVSLLLQRSPLNGGKTTLHMACDTSQIRVVNTIVDLIPNADRFRLIIATDENENTVLHSAVASGDKSLVLALNIDQLTGEQQYAVMVKENKNGLRTIDLAKQQNVQGIDHYLDDLLQESAIRK